MQLAPAIARLKAEVPQLRIVGGAADLAALREAPPLQLPAAYVLALAESARPNSLSTVGALMLRRAVRFAVVLAAQNLRDPRGEAAQGALEALRAAVLGALLNWQPTDDHDPVEFAAGRLLSLADQVLWWQDEFVTADYLRMP